MRKKFLVLLIAFSCSDDAPQPYDDFNIYEGIGKNLRTKIVQDSLIGYYEGDSYQLKFSARDKPQEAEDNSIVRKSYYDYEFLKDSIGYRHYPDTSIIFNWYISDIIEHDIYYDQVLHIYGKEPLEYHSGFLVLEGNYNRLWFQFGNEINGLDKVIQYYDSVRDEFKDYDLLGIWEYFIRK